MFQFVGLLLQWTQTLLSLDRALKSPCGITDLISDKLECSEFVNQLQILILLIINNTLRQWKQRIFKMMSPSIPFDNFKDHYVIVFGLTSKQDATENFPNPELVEEPLRLLVKIEFPTRWITELIVLGEQICSVEVNNFGVVGKKI